MVKPMLRLTRQKVIGSWQLLEVDMTGRPCGRKAAVAGKGYLGRQRNRRGRQVGYVVATPYEEIVVERVFDGRTQLTTALRPLVEAAEQTLDLDEEKRKRTILRVDAGDGSVADVNWMLARGCQVHGKDYPGSRAEKLAESVQKWVTDPGDPGRQFGWVTAPTAEVYCRAVQRIAVCCRKNNGQWGVGVILSTLAPQEVLILTGQPAEQSDDALAVLWAYVRFYDQRGGGIEIEIKEDKHGLGTLTGFAMMEADLYDPAGDEMDHAAHWETSILMVLRPDLVAMDRIRNEVLITKAGAKEAGIWGRDPRMDASRELGEKIVSRIADNIGKKAQELLAGLRK